MARETREALLRSRLRRMIDLDQRGLHHLRRFNLVVAELISLTGLKDTEIITQVILAEFKKED